MTVILFLACFNMAVSIILTMMVSWALVRFGEGMIEVERLGLGLIGGSSFMTLAPIYGSVYQIETPFDQWSGILLRVGCLIFAIGRVVRIYRHQLRNQAQVDAARAHLRERGNL